MSPILTTGEPTCNTNSRQPWFNRSIRNFPERWALAFSLASRWNREPLAVFGLPTRYWFASNSVLLWEVRVAIPGIAVADTEPRV